MNCVILNRNYPPSPGITGYSACELAHYLTGQGVEVHVVTVGGEYQGGVRGETLPDSAIVHRISKVYDGKNKVARLAGSLIEGRRMAAKAASLRKGPLIAMTDPPLLNYWVARIARRRKIPWIYWAMDLYPEAFVAAGLARQGGRLFRMAEKGTLASAPGHLIALGPKQAEYIRKKYATEIPTTILPCGIGDIRAPERRPDWLPSRGKTVFGYVGNLGQAHEVGFVEAVIASLDPAKHHFVLSVYGIHAGRVLKHAERYPHVTILSEVRRAELGFIDVHLATLDPAWDHVCVPSKAVSAVCAGGSLLLASTEHNDNWHLLREAAWRIEARSDMGAGAAALLASLTASTIEEKQREARSLAGKLLRMRAAAFSQILDAIRRLQQKS